MLTTNFKVIIADDDSETRSYIKNLLSELNNVKLVGEVSNGKELIKIVKTLDPDVLLVDIEMPEMDGLNAVKSILDQDYNPYIIFLTGFDNFALNAFDLSAMDYIVKPLRFPRLKKAFDKIAKMKEKSALQLEEIKNTFTAREKIFIKSGSFVTFIDVDSIVMVERKNNKSIIYCKDTKYETAETLNALEKKLNFTHFFRSHKGFIVNLKYIKQIKAMANRTYEIIFHKSSLSALISRGKAEKFFFLLNVK